MDAFEYIIRFLKSTDYDERCEMANEIDHKNVLNILVTADFLKLDNIYEMAWQDYFQPNFNSVIDGCTLDLTSICQRVTQDVAARIPLENLLTLKERTDKFVSNTFRQRIDMLLANVDFYQCRACLRILTND